MSTVSDTWTDQESLSLGIFLEVSFALMFFGIAELLPSSRDGHWVPHPHGVLSLLANQTANLTRVVFGSAIAACYWYRRNNSDGQWRKR